MTTQRRIGLALLVFLAIFAILGPMIAPDPLVGDSTGGALHAPSHLHWLGTDPFARDIFARLARGASISLGVAAIAVTVAALLGALIGLTAGSASGVGGQLLERVINVGLALPRIIVLLVVMAVLGHVPWPVLGVILGLTGWPAVARMVRGETLRLQHVQYVAAARALGAPDDRVLWHEIFPGTVPALLVATTLGVADAILLEAGLSFMGVGVQPPAPSWGSMILDAREYITSAPWLLIAPCLALVVATSAATLLGEALRRSLQPDTR